MKCICCNTIHISQPFISLVVITHTYCNNKIHAVVGFVAIDRLSSSDWLSPTASMVVRREKLGDGLTDRSVDVLWIRMGALFLESSEKGWVNVKGCHVHLVMSAYMSCLSGFSRRMYIDSNYHDSLI
jgi:hypothetical protein